MKAFSFIHASDLHLDSPFTGISETCERLSAELTSATFSAFDKIIDLCLENQVDFLLIAGDVYNGRDRSLRAQLRFLEGLNRLADVGIAAFVAHGNHDPLDGWSANLSWPGNVHIFSGQAVESQVIYKEKEPVAQVCGMSYPKKEIKANLAKRFADKKDLEPGLFTIGVLHCNVGSNTAHGPYAPCTVQDLVKRDYDYWALGHIHKKAIINDEPLVVYSGNTQGLNPKETEPRGCYLVRVDAGGEAHCEFMETDAVRWFAESIAIGSLSSEADLISALKERIEEVREKAAGRTALCRMTLTGRGPVYSSIMRKGFVEDVLEEVRESELGERALVWAENIINDAGPEIDRAAIIRRGDFVGEVVQLFDGMVQDQESLDELRNAVDELLQAPNIRKIVDPIDEEAFLNLIKKAEGICLAQLLGSETS